MSAGQELKRTDENESQPKAVIARSPSFWLNIARQTANIFRAHADFFVMLLLLALLTRYLALPLPVSIENIDFFDTSWGVDLVAKAHQGVWLGKNAIFTYGPLFQWLLSWTPSGHEISLGSFYLRLWLFHYWTIILLIYLTGAFLLRQQSSWVRVFYLLLLTIFWVPINWILFDIKLLLPLACFAVFLRMLPPVNSNLSSVSWRAAVVATLVTLAFLLSSDTGIYSSAAFVIVVAASLVYEHGRATLAGMTKYVALTGAFFAICVLTINGILGKVLDFHFWRATYEVVTQYRWSQAVRMLPETAPIFWLAVALNLLVFLWQWIIQGRTSSLPSRVRAAWFAMLAFGLVCSQTLLVSSEHFHVAIVFFCLDRSVSRIAVRCDRDESFCPAAYALTIFYSYCDRRFKRSLSPLRLPAPIFQPFRRIQ